MSNPLATAVLSGPKRVLGENLHPQFNDKGASDSATQLGELKNLLVLFNSKMVRGVSKSSIDKACQKRKYEKKIEKY
jgi:hypothetical protein